jgi:hypothetical protein
LVASPTLFVNVSPGALMTEQSGSRQILFNGLTLVFLGGQAFKRKAV